MEEVDILKINDDDDDNEKCKILGVFEIQIFTDFPSIWIQKCSSALRAIFQFLNENKIKSEQTETLVGLEK